MSGSHIGIKIADGSFYPIFEKTAQGKKRLTLTTAHEGQQAVHVSLYQGDDSGNAEYIGTLMVENISPAGQGEAEISLVLGVDESGNLNATATDLGSGEYQSLSVSLQSIHEQNLYEMPDFSLEEDEGEEFSVDYEDEDQPADAEIADTEAADTDAAAGSEAAPASEPEGEELTLDEDFDLDDLDSLDLELPEPDTDDLNSIEQEGDSAATEDSFTFDSGEEADAEWQAALDADEQRYAGEPGVAQQATAAAPEAAAEDEFDLSLDEEDISLDLGDAEADEDADSGADGTFDELDDLGADSGFDLSDLGDLDDYQLDEGEEAAGQPAVEAAEEPETPAAAAAEPERAESAAATPRTARMGFTADFDTEPAQRGASVILFLGFVILALAALGFLTYIIFRAIESPSVPPIEAGISLFLPFRTRGATLLRRLWQRRSSPT